MKTKQSKTKIQEEINKLKKQLEKINKENEEEKNIKAFELFKEKKGNNDYCKQTLHFLRTDGILYSKILECKLNENNKIILTFKSICIFREEEILLKKQNKYDIHSYIYEAEDIKSLIKKTTFISSKEMKNEINEKTKKYLKEFINILK